MKVYREAIETAKSAAIHAYATGSVGATDSVCPMVWSGYEYRPEHREGFRVKAVYDRETGARWEISADFWGEMMGAGFRSLWH